MEAPDRHGGFGVIDEDADGLLCMTLEPILRSAGIDPSDALVIRHAYVKEHEDTGLQGIHADSTDDEISRVHEPAVGEAEGLPRRPAPDLGGVRPRGR